MRCSTSREQETIERETRIVRLAYHVEDTRDEHLLAQHETLPAAQHEI